MVSREYSDALQALGEAISYFESNGSVTDDVIEMLWECHNYISNQLDVTDKPWTYLWFSKENPSGRPIIYRVQVPSEVFSHGYIGPFEALPIYDQMHGTDLYGLFDAEDFDDDSLSPYFYDADIVYDWSLKSSTNLRSKAKPKATVKKSATKVRSPNTKAKPKAPAKPKTTAKRPAPKAPARRR